MMRCRGQGGAGGGTSDGGPQLGSAEESRSKEEEEAAAKEEQKRRRELQEKLKAMVRVTADTARRPRSSPGCVAQNTAALSTFFLAGLRPHVGDDACRQRMGGCCARTASRRLQASPSSTSAPPQPTPNSLNSLTGQQTIAVRDSLTLSLGGRRYPRVHDAMQRMGMSMMTGGDAPTLNLDRETVSNMDSLLRVFGGRQQRSNMEEVAHHGGQPRRWRRQIGLEGLEDCEPVESAIWCSAVSRTNISTR